MVGKFRAKLSCLFIYDPSKLLLTYENTSKATLEGVWDHLELGSGLGRECDGLMWCDDDNV